MSLGTPLMMIFTMYQVSMISGLFMSISIHFNDFYAEEPWINPVMSGFFFSIAIFDMIYLYVITMTAERAHESLQSLVKPLEKLLCESVVEVERESLRILVKEIEKTGPLTGNGYFDISRSTLTSIVSTSITYLIILLQFRNI